MSVDLKYSFKRPLHFNNDPLQAEITDYCKWGKTPPTLFGAKRSRRRFAPHNHFKWTNQFHQWSVLGSNFIYIL